MQDTLRHEPTTVTCNYVKGPFYSNCLLEALKAKIRHPLKVKLTFVKQSEAGTLHVMWSDGEFDYDFGTPDYLEGIQILWFSGHIRKRRLGFNQRFKAQMEAKWAKRK